MNKKFYAFCFAILAVAIVAAQPAPGGVSGNLKMWVKSNSGTSTTTNGNPVSSWTYANDGTKSFTATGSEQPIYNTSILNFNPGLTFSGGQMMDGPAGVNAPITIHDDDYAIFGVWRSTSSVSFYQRVWSQRHLAPTSNDGASLWLYTVNGTYGDQPEVSPFTQGAQQPYTTNTWYISQLNLLNQATNDLEIIDQTNLSTSPLVANTDPNTLNGNGVRDLSDQLNRIGARDNATDEPLTGNIAELIVYDAPVSGASRNKIFSYLAMKYGITTKTDLVNSAGTTVWNSTTNSTYNNAVFGLGRDDNSGLSISQSNSIETGSGNGTGQSGKGNIVLSSPSSLDNNDFLMVGNDNGALTETTSNIPPGATGSKRLARQWRAQHTGNIGTVSLSFDFTGLTVSGTIGNVNNFRLMVDQDGDGNFTTGTVRYYTPASFTGNVANFTGVTLNNGEVFAILSSTTPATLPVTWKDFTASLVNGDAHLNWTVENNSTASHYIVEHSTDGIHFENVGVVTNSERITSYNFTHRGLVNGKHFYRINEIDIDGRNTYSRVISVDLKGANFVIYLQSNPVKDQAQLVINSTKQSIAKIELWSVLGTKISNQQQTIVTGTNKINIPVNQVAPGSYLIKVTVEDLTKNLRFIKF